MQQAQQILEKCKQVLKLAQERYDVDFNHVQIRFDLKGRSAGQAYMKSGVLGMRFNCDMLTREAFDHVLNATVPHEVAHLVCFVKKHLGKGHDAGWERICIALGGSGATRHQEDVVYGKGNTYEYCTTNGHKVRVGNKHHRYIQQGGVLRYRNNKGTVSNQCSYELVGVSGRTLSAPVQIKAPATVQNTVPVVTAPVQQAPAKPLQRVAAVPASIGLKPGSKAAQAREIMLRGKLAGTDYETVISQMMVAIGYDRQLARATYKANAARVGITL